MITKALIFAAGLGTRMQSNLPKCLHTIGQSSLLEIIIKELVSAGFNYLIFNCHFQYKLVVNEIIRLSAKYKFRYHVSYESALLDTGGGMQKAYLSDEPILTLNSDTIWQGGDLIDRVLGFWQKNKMQLLMVMSKDNSIANYHNATKFNLNTNNRICLDASGDYIYCGIQIIEPSLVRKIPDAKFSLSKIFYGLGDLNDYAYGLCYEGKIFHLGDPVSLHIARNKIKYGSY